METLTKFRGSYPTFDDYLVVDYTKVMVDGEVRFTTFEDIHYYEGGEEVSEPYLIKKYGLEEARKVIVGAIRNSVEVPNDDGYLEVTDYDKT